MTDYALPPTPSGVDEEAWRTAVSAIRDYCGWHIAPVVTEDIQVDGSGGSLLLLPTRHLTAVTGVINDDEVILDEDVHFSPRGTVRLSRLSAGSYVHRYWSMDHYGAVQLTITHGWPDFPPQVLAVARNMAGAGWGSTGGKLTSGPHSVELSPAALVGAAALSDGHIRVLERFKVRNEL